MMTAILLLPGRRAGRLATLVLLAGLAACGSGSGLVPFGGAGPRLGTAAPVAAPVAAPRLADPLAAFAANATPGAEAQVVVDGAATRARLQRSYVAASGRECREVLLGSGVEERSAILCRGDEGWLAARPLLRSGSPRS